MPDGRSRQIIGASDWLSGKTKIRADSVLGVYGLIIDPKEYRAAHPVIDLVKKPEFHRDSEAPFVSFRETVLALLFVESCTVAGSWSRAGQPSIDSSILNLYVVRTEGPCWDILRRGY